MAKGWESKSVEDQVQQHQAQADRKAREPLTNSQLERSRRREVLLLSRTRVQRDLQRSLDQRYREQLSCALRDLESQLAALDNAG